MKEEMDSYQSRLASAMAEAGFATNGGQSRFAKEIGCKSQTINQALSTATLSAVNHVRACTRLGVMPMWLAEGRGPRYDPAGPRAAIPGAQAPHMLPSMWQDAASASYEPPRNTITDASTLSLNIYEDDLIRKMRKSKRLASAIYTLVGMADLSLDPPD